METLDDPRAAVIALGMTLLAGLSTGLGGLLVALKRRPSERFMAAILGLSAGVMVYISLVELLPEGIANLGDAGSPRAELWGTVAFFGGITLIAVIDRVVPDDINPHEEPGARSASLMRRMGVMTALAIAIHNFPEGFATFFTALQDPVLAAPLAVAIAIHNIPEGAAIAVPLRETSGSRWRAVGWATASGLAEPLGAVVGFLLLQPFLTPAVLGVLFAGVAGVMVFVSVDKLLPTAIQTGRHHTAIYGLVAGMGVMALSLLLLPS